MVPEDNFQTDRAPRPSFLSYLVKPGSKREREREREKERRRRSSSRRRTGE
jgi:hypothetical protein